MLVPFNLPHLFYPGSNKEQNARALQRLMACLINLNLDYLQSCGGNSPRLYNSGVYYGRTREWEPIPALYQRGYGDCKSLTAAFVAECIRKGKPAKVDFRFAAPPHENKYHILVNTPDGNLDPSKALGMGDNEWAHMY